MTNKLWPVLILTTCTFLMVYSSPTYHAMHKRGRSKLCGKMLVQALAIVCDSRYYDPGLKRSSLEESSIENPYWESNAKFLDDPLEQSPFSKSSVIFDRIARSGVSAQCCQIGCSYSDLLSYCSP